MGESSDTPLKLQFDRRVRLDFRGPTITSDAGLLACPELDAALGRTETANDYIHESRTGRNVQHPLLPLLRQSVYTGKTHVALGLGLAACQRGLSVGFTTAASLVHELIEARDERRLLNLQKKLARLKLLIIDELGFVPLSKTGAELLFEVFSQRYERGPILVTTNLPFDEWTEVFGSERLTGALLDRLTHRVHILEMNGESYRLKQSRPAEAVRAASDPADA